MVKVFFVLSEEIQKYYTQGEPPTVYRICEIVAANNVSQARYLAWKKTAKYGFEDIRDIPKFKTKVLGTIDIQPRVLTEEEAKPWWDKTQEKNNKRIKIVRCDPPWGE